MNKVATHFLSAFDPRVLKRSWKIIVLLTPCFGLSLLAAHWLRFEGNLFTRDMGHFRQMLPWFVAFKLLAFAWFGVFRGWNSLVTFHDLLAVLKAAIVSTLGVVIVDFALTPLTGMPRSIFILDWSLTMVLVGSLRSLSRLREESGIADVFSDERIPVLIVGTDEDGESLLRFLKVGTARRYKVAGFVTTDNKQVGLQIGGVRVLGRLDHIGELIQKHRPHELLIASGRIQARDLRSLIKTATANCTKVKKLPSYDQLLRGDLNLQPRPVSIHDLLRRPQVDLDQSGISDWLSDRALMITGAAGSIGSEITRQLIQFQPRKIVVVDRWENGLFHLERSLAKKTKNCEIDVCVADAGDRTRMKELMASHRPDVIFHAAAYKHVPLMEANPGEAVKNIVLMTSQLADLALEHGVGSFVMISSDKAVNPTNVMGACKRVAELYVQSLQGDTGCDFVTVRFGNVLDSAGSVVPIFREQIARGGPVTVTHPEMVRYFMTIPEASRLVIQAGALGEGGEIFVLDMGNPVRIVDLAEDMIRLSGLEVGKDVEIKFVGRRPGEKLYEELYSDDERHKPTKHPKIMVADCQQMSRLEIARAIRRLRDQANAPRDHVLAALADIVPGFAHEHVGEFRRAA